MIMLLHCWKQYLLKCYAPYILHPTRPRSKSLIDNILLNSMEFPSHSGSLTISLSDHLIHIGIGPEHNYKHFNERELNETLSNMNWNVILSLDENDPNISKNNFHQHIHFLLDEFAPYIKLSKRELKLSSLNSG